MLGAEAAGAAEGLLAGAAGVMERRRSAQRGAGVTGS